MAQLPNLILKPKSAEAVRQGYPWIYSSDIEANSSLQFLSEGELVQLQNKKGIALGTGFINRQGKITARMLSLNPKETINALFFTRVISHAHTRKNTLLYNDYLRLVHAEADNLAGLTIDRFGGVFVCEFFCEGIKKLQPFIQEALVTLFNPSAIIVKYKDISQVIFGSHTDPAPIYENGITYFCNLLTGQKTGWYYDQRENRKKFAKIASGKTVLDVFSYTGGFGILAAAHEAASVTFIDRSAEALNLATSSMNSYPKTPATYLAGNADTHLESLIEQAVTFDLISLDPPPFIKKKEDKIMGLKGYLKYAEYGLKLLAPQGKILFSTCSHHMSKQDVKKLLEMAATQQQKTIQSLLYLTAAADHPIHPLLPQSHYLNGYLATVNVIPVCGR